MLREIEAGLQEMGLSYSGRQVSQLAEFSELLKKWNKAFNLIGRRKPDRLLSYHIFDSLTASAYIRGNQVLDVGSGAGLPGIPLAIMNEKVKFYLLDSNGKKTRFLKQAAIELSLIDRVEVVNSRLEEYHPRRPFDTVISRAFSSLEDFVKSSLHVCDQQSLIVAMKGPRVDIELKSLNADFRIVKTVAVQVPGIEAERYLVCLQRLTEEI